MLSTKSMIGGSTQPYLGFTAIETEWLKDDPHVFLFTDGQMNSDRSNRDNLAREINKLTARLSIIAVENLNRNFDNVEMMQNAAGGDVYKLVQDNRLTKKIMSFESYCLNGKSTQISRVSAPPGFAAYGDRYFSVTRVHEFLGHVKQELESHPDEKDQLEIAQKLSITLEYLTRDKPRPLTDDIIKTFCSLFAMDKNLIRYILTEAIDSERGGQAAVLANYRAQAKNFFKLADEHIKRDVSFAVGITECDKFVSPVLMGRVLTGSYRLVDKTVTIARFNYPRAGFTDTVPVLPLLTDATKLSELQEQCLRQWIRTTMAALYATHPVSDQIIYLFMGLNWFVRQSAAVSDQVKKAYQNLTRVVLNKKRSNSVQTEYDRINAGEFPMPNSGKIEDFFAIMRGVAQKLEIETTPLKLWHEMCLALDQKVANLQERHCVEELKNDISVKSAPFQQDEVPDTMAFDYQCIVTLDDISETGGYRIVPHNSVAGACSPVYLISADGKSQMLASQNCACPVCYTALTANDFQVMGPKVAFELPASYSSNDLKAKFGAVPAAQDRLSSNRNNQNRPAQPPAGGSMKNANGKTGILVILKGTVGAGKSTTASAIYDAVMARGGSCYNEGADKYSKVGKNAGVEVQLALSKIRQDTNDDLVVVIDTCGETMTKKSFVVFGLDFTGWNKVDIIPNYDPRNAKGYFAWSLRNVLQRGKPGPDNSYYLSPTGAGISTCINVHKKKSQRLFGKQFKQDWKFDGASIDSLSPLADQYEKSLKPVDVSAFKI